MKRRNMKNFAIASCTAIVICIVCYSIAGSFGYLVIVTVVKTDLLLKKDICSMQHVKIRLTTAVAVGKLSPTT